MTVVGASNVDVCLRTRGAVIAGHGADVAMEVVPIMDVVAVAIDSGMLAGIEIALLPPELACGVGDS